MCARVREGGAGEGAGGVYKGCDKNTRESATATVSSNQQLASRVADTTSIRSRSDEHKHTHPAPTRSNDKKKEIPTRKGIKTRANAEKFQPPQY